MRLDLEVVLVCARIMPIKRVKVKHTHTRTHTQTNKNKINLKQVGTK